MLFKIFRGVEGNLTTIPCKDGNAYFCEDSSNFFIDVGDGPGDRLQINAYAAQVLKNDSKEIDIDDILLKDMILNVAQGGTGASTLTVNALLVGNGENPIKMVAIEPGSVVVGDSENGVSGKKGVGTLYALSEGALEFGILPIAAGGTGGTTEAEARTKLDVYSKVEADSKVAEATTVAYNTTLFVDSWVAEGVGYKYTYANTALMCGKEGNVPPIVTCTANLEDYAKLNSLNTVATPKVGITFYADKLPEADIPIIIMDVK